MPTGVLLAFKGDDAGVVRVGQETVDGGDGEGVGRGALGGWPSGQAQVGQLLLEVLAGVVAGGVELEGFADEGCPLGVEPDGVDAAALDGLDDVEVAQGCGADGAALLDLAQQLDADVGSVGGAAVLVDGGQHAVDELTLRGFVDVLGGGDEGDVGLAQLHHGDGVVEAAAVEAGELVDHDAVDIATRVEALEHGLELGAVDGLGAAAPQLDVLVDDGDAELLGLGQADFALGGDGEALGVVVGVDLRGGRDAQVEHGGLGTLGGVHG